jgi:hypothetical protein
MLWVVRFLSLLLLFGVTAVAVGIANLPAALTDFCSPLAHTLTDIRLESS